MTSYAPRIAHFSGQTTSCRRRRKVVQQHCLWYSVAERASLASIWTTWSPAVEGIVAPTLQTLVKDVSWWWLDRNHHPMITRQSTPEKRVAFNDTTVLRNQSCLAIFLWDIAPCWKGWCKDVPKPEGKDAVSPEQVIEAFLWTWIKSAWRSRTTVNPRCQSRFTTEKWFRVLAMRSPNNF